jgi:CHRD domain
MKKLAIISALAAAFAAPGASADSDKVRARLTGYQEVPAVSTVAAGRFEADIHRDGQAFDWELEYGGLQGTVQQAHIHFAQKSVNGAIVVWLCGTGAPGTPLAGPPGTQTCPQSGTIRGTAMAGNVGPGSPTQQLTAGEIAEVIAAMRAGVAYANVHTNLSPGGEIRGQINGPGRGDDHRHDHDD